MIKINKSTVVTTVLGGVLLIGGAMPLLADARSNCEKRVQRAEQNLQREIERHGERGRNVEQRRQQVERERQNCRRYDRHDNDHHEGNDRR